MTYVYFRGLLNSSINLKYKLVINYLIKYFGYKYLIIQHDFDSRKLIFILLFYTPVGIAMYVCMYVICTYVCMLHQCMQLNGEI